MHGPLLKFGLLNINFQTSECLLLISVPVSSSVTACRERRHPDQRGPPSPPDSQRSLRLPSGRIYLPTKDTEITSHFNNCKHKNRAGASLKNNIISHKNWGIVLSWTGIISTNSQIVSIPVHMKSVYKHSLVFKTRHV